MLPIYRQILKQEELDLIEGMNDVDAYRWITSLRRVDWDKFFDSNLEINDLVLAAAKSVPGGPIGFLKEDWTNSAIQKYKSNCSTLVLGYCNSFKKAAEDRNIVKMRDFYKLIKTLVEYS